MPDTGTHPKTTIDIADALFEHGKQVASREGITFRAPVEEGLSIALERREPRSAFVRRDAVVDGAGLVNGQVWALDPIDAWRASPTLTRLSEGSDHIHRLTRPLQDAEVVGPMVHDARIAAICPSHGVRLLWTADRDFDRFPALATLNPFEPRP